MPAVPHSILVVDDSASIRQAVATCLRAAGYRVVEAGDGREALERAATECFELVVTDLNMPRLDGLGLVAGLRALPAYRAVPMLMLTTESSDDMKARGRAAGATGWLVKPFDPQRLLDMAGRLLG
jgi:two-component system chemotaxis response regulator CheY